MQNWTSCYREDEKPATMTSQLNEGRRQSAASKYLVLGHQTFLCTLHWFEGLLAAIQCNIKKAADMQSWHQRPTLGGLHCRRSPDSMIFGMPLGDMPSSTSAIPARVIQEQQLNHPLSRVVWCMHWYLIIVSPCSKLCYFKLNILGWQLGSVQHICL